MSISQTYRQLQEKIADELGDRTDLLVPPSDMSTLVTSPIQDAIQTAITKWEREPFWFLEAYDNLFTTVPGQEFYTSADAAAIATAPNIIKLRVLVNAQRYTLDERTWSYLEDTSVNPAVTSTYPSDWAYFAEQIRLYPIPSAALPMQATYDKRQAALVNDLDTNVWTQDGYDLIRCEAKLTLARDRLHSPTLMAEAMQAIYGGKTQNGEYERGYLYALKAESARRSAAARVRPTYF